MSSVRCALWLSLLSACSDPGVVGWSCPKGQCQARGDAASETPAPDALAPICMANGVELRRKRLDIYMMVDDSSSMVLLWQPTLEAINLFISDPSSAGIGIGLQFFGTSCEVAGYAVPRVPIAPLPDNASALRAAFPILPLEETATLPAMQGAVMHAQAWAAQHPDSDVAVLLLTDGLPEECDSTVENVAQVAREANQAQPAVPTYVVVFGALGALNLFASEGGTGEARVVPPGSTVELQQALNGVRTAARSCTFALPQSKSPDFRADHVNVMHEHSDGAQAVIQAVSDQASCDAQLGGWYYDDPHAPSQIVLCSLSCTNLGSDRLKATFYCPSAALSP